MKASLSFTWALSGSGWADCTIVDTAAEAQMIVSYITNAPEELITAVTRVALGEPGDRKVMFEAEPNGYLWILSPDGGEVDIRIVEYADTSLRNRPGAVLWESRQPIEALARCVLRGFDRVYADLGDDGWFANWKRPFPQAESAALRVAWRKAADCASAASPG
ncbi:hypothetical protein [Streptomyces sp. SID3343]|uniref:hypothetical protein n=1 Tax=Streptomyces sp. SID3343 TaxID=2690260 RepID=UPI00136DDEFA|nr:hypothetical protein [Streptomyces sp. SID3343]